MGISQPAHGIISCIPVGSGHPISLLHSNTPATGVPQVQRNIWAQGICAPYCLVAPLGQLKNLGWGAFGSDFPVLQQHSTVSEGGDTRIMGNNQYGTVS